MLELGRCIDGTFYYFDPGREFKVIGIIAPIKCGINFINDYRAHYGLPPTIGKESAILYDIIDDLFFIISETQICNVDILITNLTFSTALSRIVVGTKKLKPHMLDLGTRIEVNGLKSKTIEEFGFVEESIKKAESIFNQKLNLFIVDHFINANFIDEINMYLELDKYYIPESYYKMVEKFKKDYSNLNVDSNVQIKRELFKNVFAKNIHIDAIYLDSICDFNIDLKVKKIKHKITEAERQDFMENNVGIITDNLDKVGAIYKIKIDEYTLCYKNNENLKSLFVNAKLGEVVDIKDAIDTRTGYLKKLMAPHMISRLMYNVGDYLVKNAHYIA